MAKDIRLLSGRIKNRAPNDLDSNRDKFISLDNAEPNLGTPTSDNYILASNSAANEGTRNWLNTNGLGITVSSNQIQVDEGTLPINVGGLQQSGFFPVSNSNLTTILDNIDSALNVINSTAISGSTVTGDSNFTGDGTVASPLALDSTLVIGSITGASFIRADSMGDSNTFFIGDGSQLFNLPIADSDVDSIARHALTGGVGIAYDANTGTINIDSNDANVKLEALEIDQDLLVHGNLTIEGTQTIINTSNLQVDDPLIQLGVGNESGDGVDIGFVGHYFDTNLGGKVHTGLFRDASPGDKGYYFFDEFIESSFDTGTATTTIDRTNPAKNFNLANLNVSTLFAEKGDFDSAVVDGNLTITNNGNIVAGSSQLTINVIDADSADIRLLHVGTIDSAIRINADSGRFTDISFDSIDSDTKAMLQTELVPKDAEGNIDSDQLPDIFLRNDGNDSTTGAITADGGFFGNVTGNLTGDVTGDVSGNVSITSELNLPDNAKINLGDSDDLQILHNGTNSQINNYVGALQIIQREDDNDVIIYSDDGAGGITEYVRADGSTGETVLSHYGTNKLSTKVDGIEVAGDITVNGNITFSDSDNIVMPDKSKIKMGTGSDLEIYHDGSHSYVDDRGDGDLRLRGNGSVKIMQYNNGELMAAFKVDSSVELYHDAVKKFETSSTGITVTGKVTSNQLALDSNIVITNSGVSEIALMEDASSGAHLAYDGTTNLFEIRTGTDGVGGHSKRLTIGRDNGRVDFYDSTGANVKMRWDAQTSRLGINELTPQADLDVAGDVYVDDNVSADTFTRRSSTASAGAYGSPTQIPIITVNSSGFVDSVGLAAVAGVDSVDFDSTSGKFTVFLATNDSLSATITLDPFTTANLTEDSTAKYFTDGRARSAFSVVSTIANGLSTASNVYGFFYDSTTGVYTYNGIDSDTIKTVAGITGGGGGGGSTGNQNQVVFAQAEIDDLYVYDNAYFGYNTDGTTVTNSGNGADVRIYDVDIAIADIASISFDSIDSDTRVMLQNELVPKDANGTIDSNQLPDLFLRNDGNDSTTGSITADGGFIGNLDADSGDITKLTGDSATFTKLTGALDGSNLVATSVANGKLANSTFTFTDGTTPQNVALGETLTFVDGTDIDFVTSATRQVAANNTSTLHTVTGRGDSTSNAVTFGNITTTGYIAGPASLTIDPAGVGDNTGTVVIAGNLQVDGTTTTINSTEITVNDKTITLADSSPNAAAADSSGLIVDGAGATWLYKDIDSSWTSNIKIVAPSFSGTINASDIDGTLPDDVLPSGLQLGGDGTIDSSVIPDRYLRNDGNDSTTGSITADGGFIGSLTGNASTASSATTAARWTNARTVTFTGGATGNFDIRGDSDVSVALTLSGSAVNALFVGGTGVTIADDSISIGQDVATSADVEFASVTADSVSIGEATSRDKLTIGGASNNDVFGLTFVDPTIATSGGHVSYRDSNNTITLGTVASSTKSYSVTVGTSAVGIFNDTPGKELDVTGEIRATNTITSNTGFSGNGSALTDLNASKLATGTVNTARISGAYANITGVGNLASGEISSGFGNINIGTNSVTAGSFTGDGSALTALDATELTGIIAEARLSGAYTGITSVGTLGGGNVDSTFGNVNIGTSIFTGDGSGLFNVDAATLNGIDPEEFSRTVVMTDSDNGTGPAGTGYFYKIATYTFTDTTADGTFLYTIMPEETTAAHSGATTISVQVKYGATNHTANVDILSMAGSVPFADTAFRLVKTSNGEVPELWAQSNIAGVRLKVVEVSAHKEAVSVAYNDRAAWTSGSPSAGSNAAVLSTGLMYQDNEVFHSGKSVDSATLNNPTFSGDVELPSTVTFNDGSSSSTKTKYGSSDNITVTTPNYHNLDTNTAASITGGKYLITAQRGASNHITEVNFITTSNGAGVSATEFGTVYTTSSLFDVEMDVSGGNLRLKVQGSNNTQTDYKFSSTLFFDA